MILLRNIKKEYQTKYENIKAINDISLKFNDTGFYFLVGKSGCGKTTLLNIIGLLENEYTGDYYFNDVTISQLSENKKTLYRKNYIGRY